MKLEKLHITNYRSVEDSTEFKVADVTCLVGKNESGKTTILQAIEPLNPSNLTRTTYNRVTDYPRKHLTDFNSRHPNGQAVVVTSVWLLQAVDIEKLEAVLGQGCVTGRQVEVTKGYNSKGTTWGVPLDVPKVMTHLIAQAGCDVAEKKKFSAFSSSIELYAALEAIPSDQWSAGAKALHAKLGSFRDQDIYKAAMDLLELPRIMYFSQYDRMSGRLSLDKIRQDIAEKKPIAARDQVFLDFLAFAGTSLSELAATTQFEDLKARVEAASIKITRKIFQYWSQNRHLKVQFSLEAGRSGDPAPFNTGTVMHARVYNSLHDMTVPFDERSAGFIWFFSFLVAFSQVTAKKGDVLILLDEPGLNLHGRAQLDLLRYIETELKPRHQVIYTTHSPFMVPPDAIENVRTVEDVVIEPEKGFYESIGTKVGSDVLSTDKDTVFPLQAALGYEITQSLFVGEHTLLVEGPSDILYLKAFSRELKARGRTALDRRWVVCPTNGVDKVSAFLSLFGGNKLHVAVLLDYAKGQKGKVDQLKQSKLLEAGHVFAVTEFVDQAEGDVEDLVGPETYLTIVNTVFSQKLKPTNVLKLAEDTPRLVRKVEEAFKPLGADAPEFDHYEPAAWLIEHPETLNGDAAPLMAALDRFESLFKKLNALLPKLN